MYTFDRNNDNNNAVVTQQPQGGGLFSTTASLAESGGSRLTIQGTLDGETVDKYCKRCKYVCASCVCVAGGYAAKAALDYGKCSSWKSDYPKPTNGPTTLFPW